MSHYGWNHFIHELEHGIQHAPTPQACVHDTIQAMQKLLSNPNLISPNDAQALLDGHQDGRVYHSDANGFVVLVFAWPQGAETPVHDHNTWGVMGIYEGALQVVEYVLVETAQAGLFDLGQNQQYKAEAGAISYILPPADEIHQISNPWPEPAFSIHIYGKEIQDYHIFDLKERKIRQAGGN